MKPVMSVLNESRLSVKELAEREGMEVGRFYNYVHRGIRGVHLEAAKIGGQAYTSTEAWQRFLVACNQK